MPSIKERLTELDRTIRDANGNTVGYFTVTA